MKLLHQIHLLSLALSLWKTLRWVSWFNLLDCWVRLGGFALRWVSWFGLLDCWVRLGGICWVLMEVCWVLRWISWFDFLGSKVGLLDLLGSTCLRWVFLDLRFFLFGLVMLYFWINLVLWGFWI